MARYVGVDVRRARAVIAVGEVVGCGNAVVTVVAEWCRGDYHSGTGNAAGLLTVLVDTTQSRMRYPLAGGSCASCFGVAVEMTNRRHESENRRVFGRDRR